MFCFWIHFFFFSFFNLCFIKSSRLFLCKQNKTSSKNISSNILFRRQNFVPRIVLEKVNKQFQENCIVYSSAIYFSFILQKPRFTIQVFDKNIGRNLVQDTCSLAVISSVIETILYRALLALCHLSEKKLRDCA